MELCISTAARTPSCASLPLPCCRHCRLDYLRHRRRRPVVDVVVIVHRVPILPILQSSLLASARKAWRAVTPLTLATVKLVSTSTSACSCSSAFLKVTSMIQSHCTCRATHLVCLSPCTSSDNHAYRHGWECPCKSTLAAPPAACPSRDHSCGEHSTIAFQAPCHPR